MDLDAIAPNYPDLGHPFYAGGGPGPSTDQAAQAAASAAIAAFADPVPQGRGPGDPGDYPTPQQVPVRPSLVDLINATAVGDDTAAESLPGRIQPPSSWDGEMGWQAPGVL